MSAFQPILVPPQASPLPLGGRPGPESNRGALFHGVFQRIDHVLGEPFLPQREAAGAPAEGAADGVALEAAPGLAGRTGNEGDKAEGDADRGQHHAQPENEPELRFLLRLFRHKTVLFEITTMPVSVTVNRFLSSSGK